MPLEPYLRGAIWWARGTIEYDGLPITAYLRESTRSSEEAGAKVWITAREKAERRRYIVGDQERPITFAEAILLYSADPQTAERLMPIVERIGNLPVKDISPKMVRDLGPELYPVNCTDSWRRWVITPVRAVINNAHDTLGGRCPPISIKGYSAEQREKQDRQRGKRSRVERAPGSLEWLLRFRQEAGRYHAALALLMYVTGARVGQAVRMHPDLHLDLQNGRICVPGAKGHADRWLAAPVELVVELANLPAKTPRGWERTKANRRVFGFASSCGPLKGWRTACRRAGIAYLPPHSAGRHGFGQEFNVRQPIDEKSAGAYGGWRDTNLMKRTYTHAEDFEAKIHAAFRTGLVQAENATGLKLLKGGG